MEEKNGFLIYLYELVRLEAQKSAENLYKETALYGAVMCLSEVEQISDPLEQVKHLFERFIHSDLKFQLIPWAWLKHCIEKKLITKLPREDWVNALIISGTYFEGGRPPQFVLELLPE